MVGKRKREATVVSLASEEISSPNVEPNEAGDGYDVFRKHFEANFAPLPETTPIALASDGYTIDDSIDEHTEPSEWSGLSNSRENSPLVEVIDHAAESTMQSGQDESANKKSFMVKQNILRTTDQPADYFQTSKPPQKAKKQANPITTNPSDESKVEALNLKHDLDLQRLLKESHLLEQSKSSTAPGRQRQKAIDLRLQELGSKTSLYTQVKMPQSHRKGIAQKATAKEAARRNQARENGVVLEKLVREKSLNIRRRDRAVDAPAVGRFQSGTLKLSQKDIANIQGPDLAVRGKRHKRR